MYHFIFPRLTHSVLHFPEGNPSLLKKKLTSVDIIFNFTLGNIITSI